MKYLKLFESHSEIESICKKFNIKNWKLNSDGGIDVDGNVHLNELKLTELPLKFGKVSGSFNCSYNNLVSLEGVPKEVGAGFYCSFNKLTSLEGSPIEVGGDFYCSFNKLTSLEGSPIEVGGDFYCATNKLITLEGALRDVGGDFNCSENQLTSLEGGPRGVAGNFYCRMNPIWEVYRLFPDWKSYLDSQDYDYLRGTTIIKWKFQEALDELGIELPESIKGYKYI
jgi:hypothetical protein